MIIDYNMSKDYCADWTPLDAIREMVQNAIDSGEEYSCTIDEEQGVIDVVTRNTVLPLSTLMLGQSVKDSGAIGKYGEGYKIGMLVLTREGLLPYIKTSGHLISGLISKNQFDVESFKVQVEDYAHIPHIEFRCRIGDIDLEELKRRIPAFTGELPRKPETIDIWQDRPGEIFVNGLFVTEEKLVFGYNFAPTHISLNRDRNMVDGVYWQLSEYYAGLGVKNAKLIFDLIEQDAPDVQDLGYRLRDKALMSELARLFYNKYGEGSEIAKPGTSYIGSSRSISVSSTAGLIYSACGIIEAKKIVDKDAPYQVLATWAEQNKSKLRRDVRQSLDKVITRSKGWRKADIY